MLGRLNVLGIPSFRQVILPESGKSFTTFQVQMVYNGTVLSFEKRYSEFYEFHKKLSKLIDARAEFPPKKVLNKDPKFLEVRRAGLENYLQSIFHELPEDIPDTVLDFFHIEVNNDFEEESPEKGGYEQQRPVYVHQPVISFERDAFLKPMVTDEEEEEELPSIILKGCFKSLYEDL